MTAERLEHEVDGRRAELADLMSELGRRARAVKNVGVQVRQHPWAFAAGGALLAASTAGVVVLRRRRARRLGVRLPKALASARTALVAQARPRRAPSELGPRTVAGRLLLAAAISAASVLARHATRRLLRSDAARG
jgi:hypothetical protein